MNGTHGHEPIDDREPLVDALLGEQLGGETPPETALVLARWQRGDGADAAARAALAARTAGAGVAALRMRSPRFWLTAAAVLLGLCGVLSALLLRGDGRERTATPPPPQDPVAPGVVPVEDLDQLRALLPQVTAIEIEILRLDVGPQSIEVGGRAVHVAELDELRAALADVRLQAAGEWKWQNRFDLLLPGNRRIAMAVGPTVIGPDASSLGPVADLPHDANVVGAHLTLGVQGLRGDLAVDCKQGQWLRKMIEAATNAARAAHGIVRSAKDLDGESALPADCKQLRLFGDLHGADFAKLERFTQLERLDLSGLRWTLTAEELTAIGQLDALRASLRELCLEGCRLCDDDLVGIVPFVHLQRLDLRLVRGRAPSLEEVIGPSRKATSAGAAPFTGEGFRHFSNSSARRDGPTAVDLTGCDLSDAGLVAIAQWSPRELVLKGAGHNITATGWQALMSARNLERLDLTGWPIDRARMRDLAARTDLVELTLRNCGLDDVSLALLGDTKAPLRRVDTADNFAVSPSARAQLRARLPLCELLPADANVPPEIVPVENLAALRALLPSVVRADFTPHWLTFAATTLEVTGFMSTLPLEDGASSNQLAAWFADARVEQPAGWEWPNTLRLHLPGNRAIELSVQDVELDGRWRVGLRGLRGDLSISSSDAQGLRQLVRTATGMYRQARGIVVSAADLDGPDALRSDSQGLVLLGIAAADLPRLARFTDLKRLDLSHLAASLTAADLRTIAALPNMRRSLESLRLSHCTLADTDLTALGALRQLAELDLADMQHVTGEFFQRLHPESGTYRALDRIDLSGCPLTDRGLQAALMQGAGEALILRDAGGEISNRFWSQGNAPRSRLLDLSGWQLTPSRVKALVRQPMIVRLVLARCGIDDEMLQVLADGTAPITSLDLDDNPAITDSGLLPLLDLPGLRELSLRRCPKVTDTGGATLQQQRPQLQITR